MRTAVVFVLVLAVAACCALRITAMRRGAGTGASAGTVDPTVAEISGMAWAREVSAVHYERALRYSSAFWRAFQQSYVHAACTPDLLDKLTTSKRRVLKNLTEIRMRMANEPAKTTQLDAVTSRTMEAMAVAVQDVRQRGQLPRTVLDPESAAEEWRTFYEM